MNHQHPYNANENGILLPENYQDDRDSGVTAFSFGDPESVLDNSSTDYLDIILNSEAEYYVPPVSRKGLIQIHNANGHHHTVTYFRKNLLLKDYIDNDILPAPDLIKAAIDYDVIGECYFQRIYNRFGQFLHFKHKMAKDIVRRPGGRFAHLKKSGELINYKKDEIVQLKIYDPDQDIYGIPEYFGAIHSILLNEDATLFRRKFYRNGNHMGYLFVTTGTALSTKDEEALRDQISKSKGVGNFRSLYLHMRARGIKPDDAVKIIPVGEIATKDEFERIKNITRNDILSARRVRPELAGMMPENNSGTGDLQKISDVNYENEVIPFQNVFLELNRHLVGKKISFKPRPVENTA